MDLERIFVIDRYLLSKPYISIVRSIYRKSAKTIP